MALQQLQDPRRKQTGPFAVAPAAAVPRAMAPNLPNQPSMLPTKIVRPPPIVGGGNPAAAMNPLAAMGSLDGSGAGGGSPASNSVAASPVLRPGQASPDVNPQAAGTSAGVAARGGYKAGANTITDALNASLKGGAALVNHMSGSLRADAGTGVDFVRGLVGADPRANAGQPFAPVQAPQLKLPYATAKPVNFAVGGELTGPAAAAPSAQAANAAATAPAAPQLADNISAGNLAAAQRFGTAAAPSQQIQLPATTGGVDIAASPINPASHLPVGAMVNGVPTFSDGTGGIARTMTDDQIKHYGDNLSRADVGAAGNVLASDTLGGATPTQEQMVAQRIAQIQQPITGSRPSAAQFAEADRNAIASRDPRSAAGTAARNLSIDAQYGGTPRLRRMAEAALANLQTSSQQSGLAGQQAEAQSADTAATGRNALQAIELQGQNELANTALSARLRPPTAGQLVQAADGTYTLVNPSTAVTTAVLQDGKPLKGQLKNPAPPIYTSAGGAASLKALTDNILGVDPISGMIADKNAEGGHRLPTNEETFAAMQKAQGQLQQLSQPAATSGAPASEEAFLTAARKVNPNASDADLRAYYAKTYGNAK